MSPSPDDPAPPFPWRYAVALMVACVFAAMLVLPYEIELERRNAGSVGTLVWKPAELALYVEYGDPSPHSSRWGPQEVVAVIVMGMLWPLLAIVVGLKLGPSAALAWPPVAGCEAGPRRFRRASSIVLLAMVLGIASVFLLWASGLVLMSGRGDESRQIDPPSWWVATLASLGAGIREEVWLRLGVMTTVVWIAAKLTRQRPPGPATIWFGIVSSGLLFGALHLPTASSLFTLSGPLIAYVLIGGVGISLVFGWLYWRKGLIAAMIANSTQDIITKAILPMITG